MKLSREPAVWLGFADTLLSVGVVFHLPGLTMELKVIIVAVINAAFGVVSAYLTKHAMLGVLVGLIKAFVTLLAYFGIEVSLDQLSAIVAFVTVALALFQRTQTSPDPAPSMAEKGYSPNENSARV